LLGHINNALLKVYLEKQADHFAAQFSSKEELEAAAQFFEQYEHGAKKYLPTPGLAAYLPITALTGHPEMTERVAYLRKAADEKQA
jgi:Zn-dependent protease with chaperone function